jgi:Major capsid protein 13-like
MALTKLVDIIEPAVFLKYTKEYNPNKLDLLNSSVFGNPIPELASQMSAGGSIIDVPYWQDTSRVEPDLQTDDETVNSVSLKISATKLTARKIFYAKSWQMANLAGAFATGNTKDPLRLIGDYTENYWRNAMQQLSIKALDGVLADNVLNDSADMRYLVYSDVASPTAANKLSPAAVNRARASMGENMNDIGTLIMHSKVYTDALDQEAISFVQPSHLPYKIQMFAGCEIIVSNDVTVTVGTNSPKYRTYIMGAGALQKEVYYPEDSVEVWRSPEKGNGAGVETMYNRRHVMIHPNGFRFTSASVAGKSPTWAELSLAANWDRKYQRNNCKLAFLETN